MQYVIIGAGPAGIAAAEAIRRWDHTGNIATISDDPYGHYSRPGLAYYLTGELPEALLYPKTNEELERLNLKNVRSRVLRVDRVGKSLELQDGSWIEYDRLLLSTGATAVQLHSPGTDLEGVAKLDNLVDAKHILNLARRSRRAVVVGGGITALEIVEGLIARRVKVHYFLRGNRYWSNVLDEIESRVVEERLKEEGVQIHYNTEMEEILGRRGKVWGVRTKDGRTVRCEMVAIAVGIHPRKELAENAGLEVDRGILVDEHMRTSDPYIYSAGDAAQVLDPETGRRVLDSLWGPARAQGRTAGANMTFPDGTPRKLLRTYCKPIAFNVTRLANLTTTIIGTVGRGSDKDAPGIVRGDSETWRQLPDTIAAQGDFDVNRLRILVGDHTLVGAVVMGDQTLSRPLQHLITHHVDVSSIREKLFDGHSSTAEVLAGFWAEYRTSSAYRQTNGKNDTE